MAECPSFLRQINTPLDRQTTSCLSVHPSLDSWVACWHIMCYVAFQSCVIFGGKKALKITCSAICWVNSTHARTRPPPPTPWPGPGCHPETGGAHDLSPGAFLTPTGWGEVTPTHQPFSTLVTCPEGTTPSLLKLQLRWPLGPGHLRTLSALPSSRASLQTAAPTASSFPSTGGLVR